MQRDAPQSKEDNSYRWLCTACSESGDWTASREEAADGAQTHAEASTCYEFWITVIDRSSATRERPHRHDRTAHAGAATVSSSTSTTTSHGDATESATESDRFDIPTEVGYRLVGEGVNRTLVGPCGRVLTDKHSSIRVVAPGEAVVGMHERTVRWQPDLRELDAWEHRSRLIGGYGPDGQTFSPKEQHSEAVQ